MNRFSSYLRNIIYDYCAIENARQVAKLITNINDPIVLKFTDKCWGCRAYPSWSSWCNDDFIIRRWCEKCYVYRGREGGTV